MSVEQASEYIYRVSSDSDAKKSYIVDITPGAIHTCTCVAWVMARNRAGGSGHEGKCKHLDRVRKLAGVSAETVEKVNEKRERDLAQQKLEELIKEFS